MIIDTTVYDRQRESFVITRRAFPYLTPIPFYSDQFAEYFINDVDCSSSEWRTLLNNISFMVNARAAHERGIKKQLVLALKSGALRIYRKKQFDLHQLVQKISFEQSEPLTLEIPCRWHIKPLGIRQDSSVEKDALQHISALSADDAFWRNVIQLITNTRLECDASNDARSEVAKLLVSRKLYIHKHPVRTFYIIQEEPSPLPSRASSPVSSLKRSSPEPEPIKDNKQSTVPEPDVDAQIKTLKQAAIAGTPFCEECEKGTAEARMKRAS